MSKAEHLLDIYADRIRSESIGAKRFARLARSEGHPCGSDTARAVCRRAKAEPSTEITNDHALHATSYTYDKDKDEYQTAVRGRIIRTTGDFHRKIVQWYSDWGGKKTVNEVVRLTGMPRARVLDYLRAHQLTHDVLPLSAEVVSSGDIDELAQDVLAIRFGDVERAAHRLRDAADRKDAESWRRWEDVCSKVSAGLARMKPAKLPPVALPESPLPFSLILAPTDLHWGLRTSRLESDMDYGRAEALGRLQSGVDGILRRLPGAPTEIVLGVGSDWFHVDAGKKTTTRGTPQDVDGTALEIMISGGFLCRSLVDRLATVAPVRVVLMPGNHDRYAGSAILLALRMLYETDDRVRVIWSHKPRAYQVVGDTMICLTHGDGPKTKDLPGLMAAEQPAMWGCASRRIAVTGHLHHREVLEHGGVTVYGLSSLAPRCAWSARRGYVNRAGIQGLVLDGEGGEASVFVPVG